MQLIVSFFLLGVSHFLQHSKAWQNFYLAKKKKQSQYPVLYSRRRRLHIRRFVLHSCFFTVCVLYKYDVILNLL